MTRRERFAWWLACRYRCRWIRGWTTSYRVCRDGEKCGRCNVR